MTDQDDDFFTFHYKVLGNLLMVPPEGAACVKILYWIVAVPHFTLISMSVFMEGTNLFLVGNEKFSSNVLNFGVVILHIMAINRVIRWLFIQEDFNKVLIKVRQIGFQFTQFDKLYVSHSISSYYNKTMLQTKGHCQRIIRMYLIYVPLNLSVSYVMNSLSPTVERWNPTLNKTSLYRDYPYPLWYPFDTSLSDGYYWLGFFYQPYAFYFLISGFFCVDWLCICTIIHLTSFVDVLGEAFKHVDADIKETMETMKIKEVRLKVCFQQLQDVYECATALNNIFSSQLLIQELCMAGVVCCCVYKVTSDTTTVEAGYLSSMVAAAFIELFTVSWFNQKFTTEVFNLLPIIYDLDWLSYSVNVRKMLVFLIARIQKPFFFTMGLGFKLDLAVFITMIRTSYSLFTLINQSAKPNVD